MLAATGRPAGDTAYATRALPDRDQALAWLDQAERRAAERPAEARENRATAEAILVAYLEDPTIALRASRWLLSLEAKVPLDAPRTDTSPAATAAIALRRLLEGLTPSHPRALEIALALATALRHLGTRDRAEARTLYERIIDAAPDHGEAWFGFGLLDKWSGRFSEAVMKFEQARRLLGDERRVLFNLATCAIGAGDGDRAEAVFASLGLASTRTGARRLPEIPNMPPAQLRVLARGAPEASHVEGDPSWLGFELLWIAPRSIAHGVIVSPSFRDSAVDYSDLVLFDPQPIDARTQATGAAPVFPLLALLAKGDARTHRVIVSRDAAGEIERLRAALPSGIDLVVHGEAAEAACGTHGGEARVVSGERPVYGKLTVLPGADLRALAKVFEQRSLRGRVVAPDVFVAVGDTQSASRARVEWGLIERNTSPTQAR